MKLLLKIFAWFRILFLEQFPIYLLRLFLKFISNILPEKSIKWLSNLILKLVHLSIQTMPVSTRVEHGNSIYSEAKISIDIGLQKNSLWKVLMALNFCMGALRMGMYLRERFFLPNKITFQKVVFWNRFTSVFIIISILSSISVDLITQTTREANLVGFAVFFLSVTIWWYLYSYFLFQGRLRILLALYHSIGTVTSFLYLLGLANIGFITNPLEMKLYQGLSSGQIIYILMSALIFSAAWVLLLVFPSPLSRGIIYRKNLL